MLPAPAAREALVALLHLLQDLLRTLLVAPFLGERVRVRNLAQRPADERRRSDRERGAEEAAATQMVRRKAGVLVRHRKVPPGRCRYWWFRAMLRAKTRSRQPLNRITRPGAGSAPRRRSPARSTTARCR